MIKIISFLYTDEDRTIETFTHTYKQASHCDPLNLIPMVVKEIDDVACYLINLVTKIGFLKNDNEEDVHCKQVITEFVNLTNEHSGRWVQWSLDNDEKLSLVICSDDDWTQLLI